MSRREIEFLFIHLGFVVLISQALFVREFLVIFYGNEIAIGVFFAAWLWWIGAGAMLARKSDKWNVHLVHVVHKSKEEDEDDKEKEEVEEEEEEEGQGQGLAPRLQSPVPRPPTPNPQPLLLLFLALPLAALAELLILRHARAWIGASHAEIPPLESLAAIVFAATIPVGVFAGLIFPLGCSLAIPSLPSSFSSSSSSSFSSPPLSSSSSSSLIGRLYGLEALGSCAGGLAFTFWWIEALSPITIVLILAALVSAHVLAAGLMQSSRRQAAHPSSRSDPSDVSQLSRLSHFSLRLHAIPLTALVCLVGAVVILSTGLASRWSATSQRARFAALQPDLELLEELDTRYQHIAIARRGEQYTLLSNGKIANSFPDRRAFEQRAAFALAQRPDARRVLLLGGGIEGLAQEFLRYRQLEQLAIVEQDAASVELIRRHLPDELRAPLDNDPRVVIVAEDARRYVARSSGSPAFDLALIAMPDPSTAYLNRVYTRDFFDKLKSRLSDGGVVIASVTSAEHYLGADVLYYGASVYATLKAVFAGVAVTPGDTNTFAASARAGQVSADWRELARRYAPIQPPDSAFPPEGFAPLLEPRLVEFVRDKFERSGAPINTDLRPTTYYFNMILWGRFSGSAVADLLQTLRRAGLWTLLAPLAVALVLRALFMFGRRRGSNGNSASANFAAVVAIAGVGLFAMASDMALLFTYQSVFGFVYERVGLVVSLFMLGLAAGSLLLARVRARRPLLWLCLALAAIVVAVAAFAAAIPTLVSWAAATATAGTRAEALFFALFFAAGAISGAAFPLAALVHSPATGRPGETAAWLDATDHWAGALGALATGTLLVPLLGMEQTAWGLAAVVGCALCICLMELLSARELENPRSAAVTEGGHSCPPVRGLENPCSHAGRNGEAWAWGLAWATLSVYLIALTAWSKTDMAPATFADNVLAEISGHKAFERRDEPFAHYRVTDAPAPEAIFSSRDAAPGARGWGGPIALLIDADTQTIRRVRLIEHHETPSYVGDLEQWLRQFEGEPLDEGFRIGSRRDHLGSGADGGDASGVDAITGATITSRAIVDALNQSAYRAGTRLFGRQLDAARFEVLTWRAALLTWRNALLLLAFALMAPIYILGGRGARYALIAFNLAALGLATNQVFTLSDAARLSVGQLFTPANASALLLAALVAMTGLALGAAFCGYICPFGAAQEFLSLAGQRAGWNRAISTRALRGVYRLRYALLAAGLIGFWLSGGASGYVSFSPMQFIFSFKMTPLLLMMTIVIGAGCVRYFRFWCRCLCPAGAAVSLLNHVAVVDCFYARRRNVARCDVGIGAADEIGCLRCNRCVAPAQNGNGGAPNGRVSVNRRAAWDLPVLVVVTLLLAAAVVWTDVRQGAPVGGAATATATLGGARTLDRGRLDRGLKSGRIVDKEATYYKKAEK